MVPNKHHPLDSLLYPRSVAVIGASDSEAKWGGRALIHLLKAGFRGKIYPVNNKYEELLGLRCYHDVRSLPEEPDTVLLAIPNRYICDTIVECCELGVKNAVIISSGFAEAGEAGKARQEDIKRLAGDSGLRMVGPNCLGIVNVAHRLALSAALVLRSDDLLGGNAVILSQSGAMSALFTHRAFDRGMGLRYVVSTGNEVDLELSDFIDYVVEDPDVSVIGLFIEGVRNPRGFLEAIDKAWQADKLVVALKVGRSEVGARAAHSHTAALAGSDTTYDAIFRQKGVIRVDTFDGLIDTMLLLSKTKPATADGLGVVSASGGECGLIADRSVEIGVSLPPLKPEAAAEIASAMGLDAVQNPIDLLSRQRDDPELMPKLISAFDADPDIGALLAVGTMVPELEWINRPLADYAGTGRKPLLAVSTAGSAALPAIAEMKDAGVPVFYDTDECLKAVRAWVWRSRIAGRAVEVPTVSGPPAEQVKEIRAWLTGRRTAPTEPEAKAILAAYGIAIAREEVAVTGEQAVEIARRIGFPVALKVVSPEITHKTEVQGVRLNLRDEGEVRLAFQQIMTSARAHVPEAHLEGVLVQEMVSDGLEAIVGISMDADFGPTIVFGLGGIFVELLRDVAVRLVPIDGWDARNMIREIKAYRLLEGFRGQPPRDVPAVEDALLKLSRLASDLGDLIEEIDLNPLMVLAEGRGVKVVDALFVPRL